MAASATSHVRSANGGFFFIALKLLVLVAMAFTLFLCVRPVLLPFLVHTLPSLCASMRSWFTAPIFFVLMNIVVAALFITSCNNSSSSSIARPAPAAQEAHSDPLLPPFPLPNPPTNEFKMDQQIKTRVARSKSQSLPPLDPVFAPPLLKKSNTLESKPRSSVVPMTDPVQIYPSLPAESEDVDKKAADFIGTFYQRDKLKRMDSWSRYKARLDKSYGPP